MNKDLYNFHNISTIGQKNDYNARELLKKAARMVQPIMIKKKWSVPQLSEFYPNNKRLLGLNINAGEEIKIRCRSPYDVNKFYSIEKIVGTLLHELVHIVRGPHDDKFYKLLTELKLELGKFQSLDIEGTGCGFDAKGHRLDKNFYKTAEGAYIRRSRMAEAAEQRKKVNATPKKLGGTKKCKMITPAKAAGMAALERFKT